MKCYPQTDEMPEQGRPPRRGAWIEMHLLLLRLCRHPSPPAQGGVD